MEILVLNGSPHSNGITSQMCTTFSSAAEMHGHHVHVIEVCKKQIAGCVGCDYCRKQGNRRCIRNDDMEEIYRILEDCNMIIIASPIYFYGYSGQLQCVISRLHSLNGKSGLKYSACFLSAGKKNAFDGAEFSYLRSFPDYLKTENMGVFKSSAEERNIRQVLIMIKDMAERL